MADNNVTEANQAPPQAQTGVDDNRRRTRSQTRNGGMHSPAPIVESKGRKRASQSQPGTGSKRGRKPNPEHSKQENQDLPPAVDAGKEQPDEENKGEAAQQTAQKSNKEIDQPKMDTNESEKKVEQIGKSAASTVQGKDEPPKQDEDPTAKTTAIEDNDKVTHEKPKTDESKANDEQKQSEESKQPDDHNKPEENKHPVESKQSEGQNQPEEPKQTKENKETEKTVSDENPLKQDDQPKQAETPKPTNEEKQPSPKDDKSSDIEPIHKSETMKESVEEKAVVETSEGGDKDAPPAQAIST